MLNSYFYNNFKTISTSNRLVLISEKNDVCVSQRTYNIYRYKNGIPPILKRIHNCPKELITF